MPATLGIFSYVRNESRTLAKALASIRPVADELVVIDTGSTDDTLEIARQYADRVVEWSWRDDFAAASNYGASLLRSDVIGKWDGDWVLTEPSRAVIGTLKANNFENRDLIEGHWINEFEPDLTPLLVNRKTFFYRQGQFDWTGQAHDYLVARDPQRQAQRPWFASHHFTPTEEPFWIGYYPGIRVYHHKDLQAVSRSRQTLRLIDTELEKLPPGPARERLIYFGLARSLFEEDYPRLERYLSLLPPTPRPVWALEYEALLLLNQKKLDRLGVFLEELTTTSPQLDLIRADYWALHNPERAKLHYRRFLARYPFQPGQVNVNLKRFVEHPRNMLARLTR